ncbi:hypothetical protein YC2023_011695 [Brassica napus]
MSCRDVKISRKDELRRDNLSILLKLEYFLKLTITSPTRYKNILPLNEKFIFESISLVVVKMNNDTMKVGRAVSIAGGGAHLDHKYWVHYCK